jgi:hypothetical protein
MTQVLPIRLEWCELELLSKVSFAISKIGTAPILTGALIDILDVQPDNNSEKASSILRTLLLKFTAIGFSPRIVSDELFLLIKDHKLASYYSDLIALFEKIIQLV